MELTKQNLDRLYTEAFTVEQFLAVDPCGIVYELKKHTDCQLDVELGALFVAMITWGNRKAIRTAALHMLRDEMSWHPADFILSGKFRNSYTTAKNNCVYRTLNADNFKLVCQNIHDAVCSYQTRSGCQLLSLEEIFMDVATYHGNIYPPCTIEAVIEILTLWLAPAKLGTAGKSACKRICMYLRWMVRRVSPDFGLWKKFSQKDLYAVMDVHVCQLTAPILTTKQANWKACQELTNIFRKWCPEDPLKYDIALMTMADHG